MAAQAEGDGYAARPVFARALPGNWVPRPRLDQLLDRATQRPLTVVVAPAGAGKSAMLRGWAAQQSSRRHRVLWIDCRSPRSGRLGTPDLAELLSEAKRAKARSVVVLDDAHLLRASDLRLVVELVASGAGHCHVVLVSRRDLPLPLVRLELADEMTTIRAAQLRFTDTEAIRLIAAHASGADAADVEIVRERGQGWAAALVLGARAVASASDPVTAREALSRTEQPVLDYLLSEVFDTLDEHTRHVLLCTCSSDLVTEHDAVVMSGDADAGARIGRMAAEGFLVTAAVDEAGAPAWSYHPLLQELLRRRVVLGGPEHALHEAAELRVIDDSALRGNVGSALLHATHLHQRDRLVDLLSVHGLSLLATGEREFVAEALDAVPEDLARGNAGLAVLRALERRGAGDLKAAGRLAAEALVMGAEHADPTCIAWAEGEPILLCWLARTGLQPADDAISRALEQLALAPAARAPASRSGRAGTLGAADHARAWLLIEVAVVQCWEGDLQSARTHLDRALVMARGLGADLLVVEALAHASLVDLARGSYSAADRRAREVIARAEHTSSGLAPFVASAHVAHAWVALNDLDLTTCRRQVALVRAAQSGELDVPVELLTHLIECHLLAHTGNVRQARGYLENPPPAHGAVPRFLRRWYTELRGWLAVLDQDVEDAVECTAVMRDLGRSVDAAVIDAMLMDLRGDAEGCAAALDEVLISSRPGLRAQSAGTAAAVYRTWMALRDNDVELARVHLDGVLTRITPHHRLVLADAGREPAFVALVAQAAATEPPPKGAEELLAVLHGLRAAVQPIPTQPIERDRLSGGREGRSGRDRTQTLATATIDLTEPATIPVPVIDLTSREVDVLRELALGGSYTDIASTLFITENTVKTHLASLYRKLGATRRGEALRAAREAGLLQV
ncbi:LuxR C-terminal-related transcriptional regulator [Angustibacter sp. McL0619]|uniref:LuxR C-terminal-related transcriptional regulator n=1 Tax=Angustibacter sp. McL0619 TaxID=3415676 RepID=UPI003CFB3C5C